jgi:hypothetical protein
MLGKKREYNEAICQPSIDLKEANDSINQSIQLHTNLIEFGIPMKLVGLVKMFVTETYRRVQVGKKSDMFPIRNCLKQGDALWPLLSALL